MFKFSFKNLMAAAAVAVCTLSPVYAEGTELEIGAPRVAAVVVAGDAVKKIDAKQVAFEAGKVAIAAGQKWMDPAQNVKPGQKVEEAKCFLDEALDDFKTAKTAFDAEYNKSLPWYKKVALVVKNFAAPVVKVGVALVKDVILPLVEAFKSVNAAAAAAA